jgi:hypothetical protein
MKKKSIVENDKAKIEQVIAELDEKKNEALKRAFESVNIVSNHAIASSPLGPVVQSWISALLFWFGYFCMFVSLKIKSLFIQIRFLVNYLQVYKQAVGEIAL